MSEKMYHAFVFMKHHYDPDEAQPGGGVFDYYDSYTTLAEAKFDTQDMYRGSPVTTDNDVNVHIATTDDNGNLYICAVLNFTERTWEDIPEPTED